MAFWQDLTGTLNSFFKLGLTGVRLKNSAGNLAVRNSGDSADAEITTSKANISGDALVLNSDAAGAAADWKITLQRPAAGMTADRTFTLPPDYGTAGFVAQTDGAGNITWVAAGSTASSEKIDTTTLAFNSSGTLAMFTDGAADVINFVRIIVDTAFDGTGPAPSVSIGVSGTVSKYMASTQVDLTTAGVYEVHPGKVAQGAEALIATFTAGGGATVGSARIEIGFDTPQ